MIFFVPIFNDSLIDTWHATWPDSTINKSQAAVKGRSLGMYDIQKYLKGNLGTTIFHSLF